MRHPIVRDLDQFGLRAPRSFPEMQQRERADGASVRRGAMCSCSAVARWSALHCLAQMLLQRLAVRCLLSSRGPPTGETPAMGPPHTAGAGCSGLQVFPAAQYYKRAGFAIKKICTYAAARGFTDLVVVNEDRKQACPPLHLPPRPPSQPLTSPRCRWRLWAGVAPAPAAYSLALDRRRGLEKQGHRV